MNRDELDMKHLHNPQAGDYWNERFTPILLVIDSGAFFVACLTKRKDVGPDHWTWDTTHVETFTKAEFRKKICYSTIEKPFCSVVPNFKGWQEFAKDAVEKVLK